jgi:hypothetical protein
MTAGAASTKAGLFVQRLTCSAAKARRQRAKRLPQELCDRFAAEHAREHGASIPAAQRDAVIVGALVSALGAVSAAIARAHRFDVAQYEEFLTRYVACVFQAESARPVYH